ncbi:hypothetical protein ABPG74_011334 [Tetrahymena malaccensis]
METQDQDNLYISQKHFQSLQKQNLDFEYRDLNVLQDVSVWSETQNSKISCIQSQSGDIQSVNSAESKLLDGKNRKIKDQKIECSPQNQQTQEEQICIQIQQVSNRNIKSKTYGGAYESVRDTEKNKLSSLSYAQFKTTGIQKPMNASSYKNKNITDSITFMMKLKQKITYYQRILTFSGRKTIDKQDEQKRCDINIINEYMRQKKISQNLQSKINISLEYFYSQNTSKLHQQSEEILDKLSLDLKVSLAKEFNKKILNKIEILNKNFSNNALDLMCFASLEEFYLPNQIIYSDNHNTEPSLIYVISGQVEVVYLDQMEENIPAQYINSQIKEGQICGQIEFFTGIFQQRYFRSTEYSQVLRISNKDLIDIIKRDQKDFEKFCQIRDNILMYEQYSSLQLTCEICNYATHQVVNCPMIHLQKYFLTSKIGIEQKQQQIRSYHDRRLKFKRKRKLTENNVMHGQFVQEHFQKQLSHSNNESEFISSEESEEEQETKTNTHKTDAEEQIKLQKIEEHQETEIKTDKRKSIQIQLNIPQQKTQPGSYRQSILQQVEEFSQKGDLIDLANLTDVNLKNMAKRKQSVLNRKIEFTFEIQPYADSNHKVRVSETDFTTVLSPQQKQSVMCHQNMASQLNNSQDLEDRQQHTRRKDRMKTYTRNPNSHLTQIVRMQQFQNQSKQLENELDNPWNFEKLQDYKFYFKIQESKQHLHINQQLFLRERETEDAFKLRQKNMLDDISLWTDSSKNSANFKVDLQNSQNMSKSTNIFKFNQNTQSIQLENSNLQNEEDISQYKEAKLNCGAIVLSKKNNFYGTQSILKQKLTSPIKNYNMNESKMDMSQSTTNNKPHSLKNVRQHQLSQNGISAKVLSNHIKLTMKLKQKFSYLFKAFTMKGRSKALNSTIRSCINDKSDMPGQNSRINAFLKSYYLIQIIIRVIKKLNITCIDCQSNKVGFILETIDEKNEKKRRDINILNEFMRSKNISYTDPDLMQFQENHQIDKHIQSLTSIGVTVLLNDEVATNPENDDKLNEDILQQKLDFSIIEEDDEIQIDYSPCNRELYQQQSSILSNNLLNSKKTQRVSSFSQYIEDQEVASPVKNQLNDTQAKNIRESYKQLKINTHQRFNSLQDSSKEVRNSEQEVNHNVQKKSLFSQINSDIFNKQQSTSSINEVEDFKQKYHKKREIMKYPVHLNRKLLVPLFYQFLKQQYDQLSNNEQEFVKFNPWEFDKLKDWSYYFKYGNSKYNLLKYNKYQQMKIKQTLRKSPNKRVKNDD